MYADNFSRNANLQTIIVNCIINSTQERVKKLKATESMYIKNKHNTFVCLSKTLKALEE